MVSFPIGSGMRIPSYFALRACPRATTSSWWSSARVAAATAPPVVRAILAGRARVEVSADEARAALAWARALDGWDDDALPPFVVYPLDP